jgi:hypothetical protein
LLKVSARQRADLRRCAINYGVYGMVPVAFTL